MLMKFSHEIQHFLQNVKITGCKTCSTCLYIDKKERIIYENKRTS